MKFEVDVSGEDIFNKDYVICIANKDGIIKGYKISAGVGSIINSRHGQGLYRYDKSKSGKSLLKIRVYSIIIYCLFKSLNLKGELELNLCKDFSGREQDINSNLNYFLGERLGLSVKINFVKLDKDSNAHRYAYLMRKDTKNKLNAYVEISLEDVEQFLKK
jgi:hypothetical protein